MLDLLNKLRHFLDHDTSNVLQAQHEFLCSVSLDAACRDNLEKCRKNSRGVSLSASDLE